jgi:diguanylate cyclase (GGDEF)-like protein
LTSLARRLVVYFVFLAVVPLFAGFLGFTAIIERSEQNRVDEGLQANLRATLATYESELVVAQKSAERLARSTAFQRAVAQRNRSVLAAFVADVPGLRVESGSLRIGKSYSYAGERRVQFVGAKKPVGKLIVSVPLNPASLRRFATLAGVSSSEKLMLVRSTRVFEPKSGAGSRAKLNEGGIGRVRLGGKDYRVLVSRPVSDRGAVGFALVTPQSRVDNAVYRLELRVLFGLLGFLLLMGTIAFLEGKVIVRSVGELAQAARAIAHGHLQERVPVRGHDEFASLAAAFNEMAEQLEARMQELEQERKRLREATLRFSEGLGVSHDAVQLLRVVVESAVEATSATGGVITGPHGERFVVGEPEKGKEKSEWSLRAGREHLGTLVLSGDQFGEDELEMVALLCGHAAVALDNARLHRIVERQALIDGLTGLANRRRSESALDEEIVRASRLGGDLTLAILDIDHFKEVNDRYGHAAGDSVLKELALVLTRSLREIDTAGRWGGEEFALILPGTDTAGGTRLCERIRQTLADRGIPVEGEMTISVTASFGVAGFGSTGSRERLLAAADEALYRAKRGGRNRVECAE